MPQYLPVGFRRSVRRWAPMSGAVGPEASLPAVRNYFAVVFRRGHEHIDFTMRSAQRPLNRFWMQSDPFSGECADTQLEDTAVNGVPAKYGIGSTVVPHLFWK